MFHMPLYIKTEYSLLTSMIRIKDLIKKVKELGYDSVTITDNNMFGVMEFYKECLNNNIKPIVGLELTIEEKNFILYCKNYNGYKNLMKLSTINSSKKIDYNELENYSSDLICIVPYTSRVIYKELNKIYNEIFIGYKNKQELSHLKGNNLIYLNEILYLNKEDSNYFRYLKGIKNSCTIEEIDIENDNYLKNIDELNEYNESLKNYEYIYNNCNLKMEYKKDLLPIYEVPDNYDTFSYLKHLCKEGLKEKFGETVSKIYIDRLKYELDVINKMGFCNYFLVVRDYVMFAKENNILVGPGRGSAAGSLVSYVLKITDIDPIKYNLIFERFLNPERITMPDIDIDFEYDRRDKVINYCINKYGLKKVAGIITFGTLASKQVIRDVGRVMDLELNIIDSICKIIDPKLSLKDNKKNNKLQNILNNNKEIDKLYKIAMKLEGLKRHTSVHAAGIVMCKDNLDEIIPLHKHDDNMYLTSYSMNYLEELGLLKMDFLGLKNLNTITNIIRNLNNDGIKINFDDIPLNDKKTLDIFNKVNTIGIFQFESEGMMNFLRKFKPTNFEDIFAALALYRPGPMDNIDTYIKRKQGKEKIDYFDSSLEKILKPTYGILIYQEQIMQVANIMAGYTLGEADILRRAMSKKKEDILLQEKNKFIKQSIQRGYSEELSNKVFNHILKFASYGFNRSHSVAYAVIAYKMAYLKAHYPSYFMKSLLDNSINSSVNTKRYIYESKINNINILPPDINLSDKNYNVENNNIRFSLTGIKNIGIMAVNEIIEKRKEKKFEDIFDFVKRCYGKTINKKTIISLIKANCFSSFNYNQKTLVENLDLIINYTEIIKEIDEEYALKPVIEKYKEHSDEELMSNELELFGFYLTNNPIIDYKIKHNSLSINELDLYFDKNIDIVVIIDKIKEINTKNNDKMCFLTLSDEMNSIDGVMFPNTYKNYRNIKEGNIVLIKAKVEKRFDKLQLVINEITNIK